MIWQKIENSVSDRLFRDSVHDSVITENQCLYIEPRAEYQFFGDVLLVHSDLSLDERLFFCHEAIKLRRGILNDMLDILKNQRGGVGVVSNI